jgi:acetyltransferase
VRTEGRTLLDEHESKDLLTSYGIPTVETRVARELSEAIATARDIGFPVAVKVWSRSRRRRIF